MNDLVTWADIDAELGKGEQMGYQTVLQFAKVGQMLKAKMGDMPIREFVPHVGQHIPRLSKSSIHRYLTLADNLPLLEQKQPDSQRAALAMIADAKRPPMPLPVPKPMQQQPTPAPQQSQLDIDAAYIKNEMALADSLAKKVAAMEEAILELENQIADHEYNAGERLLLVKAAFDKAA